HGDRTTDLEADGRKRGVGAIGTGCHWAAHADALCSESRLALAIRVRLHCRRRIGARHSANDLLLYLETNRGHGPSPVDAGAGGRPDLYLEPAESHQQ